MMELALLLGATVLLGSLITAGLLVWMRRMRRGRAEQRSNAFMIGVSFAAVLLTLGLPIGVYVGTLEWDRRVNHARVEARVVAVEPV